MGIAELEAAVIHQNEKDPRKKKLPSLLPGISGVGKLIRSISNFSKGVGRRALEVVKSLPVIEITLPNYLVSTKASTIEEPPKLAESEAQKTLGDFVNRWQRHSKRSSGHPSFEMKREVQ